MELMGLNVAEHRVSTEVFDLLSAMDLQRRNADFESKVPVEPFTEVGQIAQLYNQVLERVNVEMSEKDQAFLAYRKSEFRNGAILDAALDSIVTINQKGQVLEANRAAEKTFYMTTPKIRGCSFFDAFFLGRNIQKGYDSLSCGFTQTDGLLLLKRERMQLRRSDASEFPAELVVTKTASEDVSEAEYTLYIRDIARRIKLEERLKSLAFHDPLTSLVIVGRWGGDEFVVTMSGDLNEQIVSQRAEEILDVLRPPLDIKSNTIIVKASIGLALSNTGACTEDDLLQNADIAMYKAKEAGKDTYRFFNNEMRENATHFFNLENALPTAISENQFYLEYQPKVSLVDGTVTGFEALIRWHHPDLGLISPNEFIPILESSSLIVDLGKHLTDERILSYITGKSYFYNVPMHLLGIEITEGVLTGESLASVKTIEKLAEKGIRLYIDDFGTGYSSLSYLSKFPIQVLKIDRAFIRNCTTNDEDSAICLAIISLAKSLNMDIVAEGVERFDQLEFLKDNGCDAYQGYYFSKPLSGSDVITLLQNKRVTLSSV